MRPNGTSILDGSTLNNPEQVTVSNPTAGNWFALVDGYSISTKNSDRFKLRLAVDGYILK